MTQKTKFSKGKTYVTDNDRHDNLRSNVPFDQLPNWLQKARTTNAIVEYGYAGITWYDGIWRSGCWHGGVWKNGEWHNGKWRGGRWEDGVWYNGVWHKGFWYYGLWHNGVWYDGLWHDGTWEKGRWEKGRWLHGEWEGGLKGTQIKCIGLAKWRVYYNDANKMIKIGCETKTIEDWEDFFNGKETRFTKRGTAEFQRIYNSYKLAKLAIELEVELKEKFPENDQLKQS